MQELFDKQRKAHEQLLYCLEGRREELSEGNRGNADGWVRHIDLAYEEYMEATDELQEALNTTMLIKG